MSSLSEMTEKAGERKEAIGVGVMEATVIMGETEMTEGVGVDVGEGVDVAGLN